MQIIYSLRLHNITNTQWIGKELIFVATLLIGTMMTVLLTYPCRLTSHPFLKKLNHSTTKNQHSPHEFFPLCYGTKTRQLATQSDTSPLLNTKETTYVQSIIGSLLYHARALDASLLPALNSISAQQNKPTQKVKEKCKRLLDYVVTYPHPILRFYASDMILMVESDAAYLVLPKAHSRAAGFFYLAIVHGLQQQQHFVHFEFAFSKLFPN